jgi:hypothetical protein
MNTKPLSGIRTKHARPILVVITIFVLLGVVVGTGNLAEALRQNVPVVMAQTGPGLNGSLTDVAGPPPVVDVRPEEAPDVRLKALGMGAASMAKASAPLPQGVMDFARPPQWTKALAGPEAPVPPDPFKTPALVVNPERVPPDNRIDKLVIEPIAPDSSAASSPLDRPSTLRAK